MNRPAPRAFRVARNLLVALLVAAMVPPTMAWATGQVVTGQVTFNASFAESVTTGAVVNYQIPATVSANLTYTNGTASNQVDTIYARQISLAATTTTLDLTSLTDPAGNSINFARVRELIVQNLSATAGRDVKIYAGASNGWAPLPASSDTNYLYARYSGVFRLSDPVSTGSGNGNVVSGTSKTIVLDPGSNTISVNVIIVGGSAA